MENVITVNIVNTIISISWDYNKTTIITITITVITNIIFYYHYYYYKYIIISPDLF